MKKVALLVAVVSIALLAALLPSNAAAVVGAYKWSGTATLNDGFPCTGSCSGTFAGTAKGNAVNGVNCLGKCSFTSDFTYSEPGGKCIANKPLLAVLGSAKGTYSITQGSISINGGFKWTRVGLTAVVTLSNPTGVSVAAFNPPSNCKPFSTAKIPAAVAIYA